MSEQTLIPLADLLIDEENPRLTQPNVGQREALRSLATYQGRKLQKIAEDILINGLDPSELFIVMRFDEEENRYVVIDGNRRLTALKSLENPDLLSDAVKTSVLTAIRRLSKKYQVAPIETVSCVIVKDRDEARHWIELRHTGEREGAGSVLWGSDENARFLARSDGLEIHTQALNFLEQRGDITHEFRRKIPTTNYKRLLEAPDVRAKIGIELQQGKLKLVGEENAVAKALLHIAKDLATGNIKVGDIYYKGQRTKYANNIPEDIVVKPIHKPGQGVDPSTVTKKTTQKSKATTKTPKQRDRLIPRDCVLNITDQRIRDIERELRRLSLEDFTNAVAVLLRVFLELSMDIIITKKDLQVSEDASLAYKMTSVTNDLLSHKKLTKQQAQPVRRACQRDSLLCPSITMMHQYIHNPYMFPGPADLRAYWDNLQPFIIAIWAP
ncbi:MAG: hypothetical protein JXA17_01735 [Dehalococcoidales bacterium]|nr:hypothetical protein [Dehalococcoidales bacterium]